MLVRVAGQQDDGVTGAGQDVDEAGPEVGFGVAAVPVAHFGAVRACVGRVDVDDRAWMAQRGMSSSALECSRQTPRSRSAASMIRSGRFDHEPGCQRPFRAFDLDGGDQLLRPLHSITTPSVRLMVPSSEDRSSIHRASLHPLEDS